MTLGRQGLYATLALLALAGMGCKKPATNKIPTVAAPAIGLELPLLTGWMVDSTIKVDDPAKGGVVLRLMREGAVLLSPRIDVYIEPLAAHPTDLEEFLNRNMREIASMENGGSVRVTRVDQRPFAIGPRRAYRVLHEYAMLSPGQAPIAVTQISTILVLDGRGVTITAAGRTELFHPLSDSIERILSNMALPVPEAGSNKPSPPQLPEGLPQIQPVDLGKVGGK